MALERLLRRLKSEAFAWGCVHCAGDRHKIRARHLGQVRFQRQVSPHSAIAVFDRAFLPGRSRVAEIGFHAAILMEHPPGHELGSPIERHGLPTVGGKGAQALDDLGHDIGGLAVRVAQENLETRFALSSGL